MGTKSQTHLDCGLGKMGFLLWLLLPVMLSGPRRVEPLTATVGVDSGTTELLTVAPAAARDQLNTGGARGVSEVCGKPRVMEKIYGGQDVVAGQWPWQASVLYQGSHLCGAVLIESRWLLSTAHCFVKPKVGKGLHCSSIAGCQTLDRGLELHLQPAMGDASHHFCKTIPQGGPGTRAPSKSQALKNYWVVLGSTRLFQPTEHTQKMAVSGIIIHPDFEKHHAFGSDIAMLQLYLPVNFTSYVVPACLPAPGMPLPRNVSCWITGWGMLTENTPMSLPFHLQEGKVKLIENKLCNMLYGQIVNKDNDLVHDEMLCAGDFSTGKAICQGDSGGPLVCNLPRAWVLVGLASWGLSCQHPVYPSIFTRVAYFTDWINKTQRLTPLPDPSAAPPPYKPLHAAGPPRPQTALRPPQLWLPLLLVFRDLQ